jgi:beta-lactamase class A
VSVTRVVRVAREMLDEGGLRGAFLVRDLRTGAEIGIDPELELPLASLMKVPLALATLERAVRGEIDLAMPVTVAPVPGVNRGPSGLSRFRYPATVAVDDLLLLTISISDGVAADELFALTPPEAVNAELRRLGYAGIVLRHQIRDLTETPAEQLPLAQRHLAYSLAVTAATAGHGHPVAQLDVSRASTGSARALVDLLQGIWQPSTVHPEAAARVRELMAQNQLRQRLAPDFGSDTSRWSSKTGTLLNLRHEVGVVEHSGGQVFAVAALTESRVPARVQPGADALMGQVARMLHDELRDDLGGGGAG